MLIILKAVIYVCLIMYIMLHLCFKEGLTIKKKKKKTELENPEFQNEFLILIL